MKSSLWEELETHSLQPLTQVSERRSGSDDTMSGTKFWLLSHLKAKNGPSRLSTWLGLKENYGSTLKNSSCPKPCRFIFHNKECFKEYFDAKMLEKRWTGKKKNSRMSINFVFDRASSVHWHFFSMGLSISQYLSPGNKRELHRISCVWWQILFYSFVS